MSARALVDTDTITVGALSLERSYEYSPERFLITSRDARAKSSYAYAPDGIPTSIRENDAPVQIAKQQDDLGRTTLRGDLTMAYGPDGQLASASRGSSGWSFLYDEAGQRVLKLSAGIPVAAYIEEGYLDASGLTEPFEIGGRPAGLIANGIFEPCATDLLGSVLSDSSGAPFVASPYGSRWIDGHPARAPALDYVEKGFDPDLGLVRMGVRDYDPALAAFVAPDPKYLESTTAPELAYNASLFVYSLNVPLLFEDPSGLDPLPFNESSGHHLTPKAVTKAQQAAGQISEQAAAELTSGKSATMGWTPKSVGIPEHGWSAAHREYSAAVNEEFNAQFPPGKPMTTVEQAKAFNDFLLTKSTNPAVRKFLDPHLKVIEAMKAPNATAEEVKASWEPVRTGYTRSGGFLSFFSDTLNSFMFGANLLHFSVQVDEYNDYINKGTPPSDPVIQVLIMQAEGGPDTCIRKCGQVY